MKISVHPQRDIDGKSIRYGLRFADRDEAGEEPENIQIVWLSREQLHQTMIVVMAAVLSEVGLPI